MASHVASGAPLAVCSDLPHCDSEKWTLLRWGQQRVLDLLPNSRVAEGLGADVAGLHLLTAACFCHEDRSHS